MVFSDCFCLFVFLSPPRCSFVLLCFSFVTRRIDFVFHVRVHFEALSLTLPLKPSIPFTLKIALEFTLNAHCHVHFEALPLTLPLISFTVNVALNFTLKITLKFTLIVPCHLRFEALPLKLPSISITVNVTLNFTLKITLKFTLIVPCHLHLKFYRQRCP